MKSERRHELETNQLADSLAKIPFYFARYGSRILLAVVLVALVVILLYNRSVSQRQEARMAADQLAAAREAIGRLQNYDPLLAFEKPQERIERFQQLVRITRESLDMAMKSEGQPAHEAETLIARADLGWLIANYPEMAGAGEVRAAPTRDERERALSEAQSAYQAVLDQFSDLPMAAMTARFGLAAIAENKAEWDMARKHYEALTGTESYPKAFRDQAQALLDSLGQIRKPVLLVEARQPLVLTGNGPATTQATTQASTQPTTQPTPAPTTAPGVE